MNQINTIIWDWNGTLLNDVEMSIAAMNPLLAERGLPQLTIDHYREVFCFPVRKYYETIGFDFEKEPFDIPANAFMDNYRRLGNSAPLTDSCSEILNELKQRGYRQFILSAMEQSLLEKMTADYGIRGYLEGVYGLSDDFAKEKVSVGKRLIKKLNLNPMECVMIGDTSHDSEVADGCGFRCVLYSGGHSHRTILEHCSRPIVDNLKDLLAIMP